MLAGTVSLEGTGFQAPKAAGLPGELIVDCSHANSGKKHTRQQTVWQHLIEQRVAGGRTVIGVMLESNLEEGAQPLAADLKQLRYGVSITDACLGWKDTEAMLRKGYQALRVASA